MSVSGPNVCVLKTDGINCDEEMQHAFIVGGGNAETVHINELREGDKKFSGFEVLAIPGGFSYGDDITSGTVLANELRSYLSDQLQDFADKKKPILGVCNGFQVLVKTGLLPGGNLGEQTATLTTNESGRFECRWVDLSIGHSACKFIKTAELGSLANANIPMQVAHGEGRFVAGSDIVKELANRDQIAFRYSPGDNPNGSVDNIAGITDESGLVLGMMPHPERSIEAFHPHREKTESAKIAAELLFKNIVNYAKEM